MRVIDGLVDAAPPCPTWFGRRVDWGPWEPALNVFICPPPRGAQCSECGTRSPAREQARGLLHPLPGDKVERVRSARTRSGKGYSRTVEVPAIAVLSLHAHRCDCGIVSVVDPGDLDAGVTLICDGCDRMVAIGGNDLEAVTTLAALGGLSERAGGASKDWCSSCVAATVAGSTPAGRGDQRQQMIDTLGDGWDD